MPKKQLAGLSINTSKSQFNFIIQGDKNFALETESRQALMYFFKKNPDAKYADVIETFRQNEIVFYKRVQDSDLREIGYDDTVKIQRAGIKNPVQTNIVAKTLITYLSNARKQLKKSNAINIEPSEFSSHLCDKYQEQQNNRAKILSTKKLFLSCENPFAPNQDSKQILVSFFQNNPDCSSKNLKHILKDNGYSFHIKQEDGSTKIVKFEDKASYHYVKSNEVEDENIVAKLLRTCKVNSKSSAQKILGPLLNNHVLFLSDRLKEYKTAHEQKQLLPDSGKIEVYLKRDQLTGCEGAGSRVLDRFFQLARKEGLIQNFKGASFVNFLEQNNVNFYTFGKKRINYEEKYCNGGGKESTYKYVHVLAENFIERSSRTRMQQPTDQEQEKAQELFDQFKSQSKFQIIAGDSKRRKTRTKEGFIPIPGHFVYNPDADAGEKEFDFNACERDPRYSSNPSRRANSL